MKVPLLIESAMVVVVNGLFSDYVDTEVEQW